MAPKKSQISFGDRRIKSQMKRFLVPFFFLFFFISLAMPVFAESSYVLPYPSFLPGSKLYRISLVWERISKYWYFGNFGQFKYNLKQSDKYLVEAKTLFEYKQYLLGFQALKKSDRYFMNILPYLIKAQKEGKNIVQKQNLLKEAALKHIESLNLIKEEIPETFIWRPEKTLPTVLNLEKLIDESILTRSKII